MLTTARDCWDIVLLWYINLDPLLIKPKSTQQLCIALFFFHINMMITIYNHIKEKKPSWFIFLLMSKMNYQSIAMSFICDIATSF